MKNLSLKLIALSLLSSLASAQHNPPPIRRPLPPIVVTPPIIVQPPIADNNINWSQRESLLQQQVNQVSQGQGQILPIRATLNLQPGQLVKKVIVIAMSRAGQGRLEVLANGRPALITSSGMQSYEKIVGASLETIEAEVNGQVGNDLQSLQLRTDGVLLISLVGATIQNQVQPQSIPRPIPQPLPPVMIVCSQDAVNVYQATFQRVKTFAYSTSGLDMTSAQATSFANDWTNRNSCNEADGYLRRIASLKEFAYATAGLDMTSAQAKQFALDNERKVCVQDNGFWDEFKQLYNFAYSISGMNMSSQQARDYAWNKIQPKYFTCLR